MGHIGNRVIRVRRLLPGKRIQLEPNLQELRSSANDIVQTLDGLADRFFARSAGHLKGCVVLKCSENYGAAQTSTFVTLRKSGKIQKRTKSFAIEWKSCESCFRSKL